MGALGAILDYNYGFLLLKGHTNLLISIWKKIISQKCYQIVQDNGSMELMILELVIVTEMTMISVTDTEFTVETQELDHWLIEHRTAWCPAGKSILLSECKWVESRLTDNCHSLTLMNCSHSDGIICSIVSRFYKELDICNFPPYCSNIRHHYHPKLSGGSMVSKIQDYSYGENMDLDLS